MRYTCSMKRGSLRVCAPRGRGRSSVTMSAMRPGLRRHHHHAIGQQDRFLDAVGDEENGVAVAQPHPLEIEIHLLATQT
jgi:hypothetical protein